MKKFLISVYIINLVIIFLFWIYSSWGLFTNPLQFPFKTPQDLGGIFLAFARIFGLLGMSFVLFQLILIGRIKWLEGRYGFDYLTWFHKENGRIASGFFIMHPIFIILGYGLIRQINFSFPEYLSRPFVILAPIALAFLLTTVVLSNPFLFNKINYNLWYYIHLINYLGISLVLWHQFLAGGDFKQNSIFLIYWIALYAFVFVNFFIYRLIKPLFLYRKHKFKVEKIEQETHDTVSIYITGEKMDFFKFKPGQFLALRFLTKELRKEVHPFSISTIFNGNNLRVTIKASGDYTKKLNRLKSGNKLIVEGPLGKFTELACKKNKILFIAAGVGITPIRSLMEQLAIAKKNIILMNCNKTTNDVIFKEELESLSTKYEIPIHYFFTREKELEVGYNLGRINISTIQNIISDLNDRDIFICAPPSMIKSLNKDLQSIGIKEELIHFEKFNW